MLTRVPGEQRPAVCIVHHYYYPEHGHVRRDAEALARGGFDVSVIALRSPAQAARETLNGVAIYRVPLAHRRGSPLRYLWEYGAFFLLTFLTLAKLQVRKRLRVVEIDNMPDFLVFSALIPKLLGTRVILYIFDNMPELLAASRGYSPRHPLARLLTWQERLSCAFADRVIVTQESARQLVLSRGVPERKLAVVLNGPDDAIFTPRPARPPDGRFAVVTHGTILERFGVQTLLDALPQVAAAVPGVHLRVIGGGEYRATLEVQAERLGIADRVEFRDWLPLEALPDELARADVGYVGMWCDLMLSNKLMDYVALGIPVVVARWSTYECYFGDDAVSYFAPGNAADLAETLIALARTPAGGHARAERAGTLYQGYRWTVQREIYLDVYKGLLNARSSGRHGTRRPWAGPAQ
jgi:glycosyltransferase involved in cell wall biosynthesis